MPQTSTHFWFSFSLDGLNQGVCIVKDKHKEPGTEKAAHAAFATAGTLGLIPKHDNVQGYSVDGLENGLKANRLYSKKEMDDLNYVSTNSQKLKDGES